MAALMRWDPFRDLLSLQRDVDRLFGGFGVLPALPTMRTGDKEPITLLPTVDVITRGDDLVIRAEMPGIKPENVDISVTDNVLTLKGERHEEEKTEERDYVMRESTYGSFERSLTLPAEAEADKIHAEYRDGILEVVVPKAAPKEARTHHVRVEAHEPKAIGTEHH